MFKVYYGISIKNRPFSLRYENCAVRFSVFFIFFDIAQDMQKKFQGFYADLPVFPALNYTTFLLQTLHFHRI